MIRTAVRVGAMFATEMAESSVKLRHPARKDPAAGLFVELSIGRYKSSFAGWPAQRALLQTTLGLPVGPRDDGESQSVGSAESVDSAGSVGSTVRPIAIRLASLRR